MKKETNGLLPISGTTTLLVLALAFTFNVHAQSVFSTDFNRIPTWVEDYKEKEQFPALSATVSSPALAATALLGKFGTVDIANTTIASDGLQLSVKGIGSQKNWSAGLHSGLLAIRNRERNTAKLTLSFDHSVTRVRPVTVRVESFNQDKKRTGGLETQVLPATADFFVRSAIELNQMKPFGGGSFNPLDPYVHFSFLIEGVDGAEDSAGLRIDNFCYTTPAYYVSPSGKNTNDGRTEKTAFADPQAALNVARAGDIILLMNGTYTNTRKGSWKETAVVSFVHAGQPAAWITLKNYPGDTPTIRSDGRQAVRIAQGSKQNTGESPLLAYLEVRGLHILGNSPAVLQKGGEQLGVVGPETDNQGIYINAQYAPTRMYHHIRIANNTVEYCGGDGIYADFTDWLTVENNRIMYNCWTTALFAQAGFSLMHYADFDKTDNVTKILIRKNYVTGNQCKVYKKQGNKIFNGNGILLDANCERYLHPDAYLGRTLVQNNLVFNNGGGGIQMWGSHRLDVVNNTLYHNGISPELKWGNMGFDFCQDVRVINNIVVALPDRPLDTWMAQRADRETAGIVRVNNLYYGGVKANIKGEGDMVADPLFVNASTDPLLADFRLKPGSPAEGSAIVPAAGLPCSDIEGKLRIPSETKRPSRGAYEMR